MRSRADIGFKLHEAFVVPLGSAQYIEASLSPAPVTE